ncbi:MAG: hypothetical protein [Olavius algarvensis Delta 4 endosymbiont]|nr:MAG: hypothetical protein [Olavius algarvensis Delta 4 endosymbiont]
MIKDTDSVGDYVPVCFSPKTKTPTLTPAAWDALPGFCFFDG